ncbi:unnamed protein product, partial [Heterotrigona itama]
PVNWQSPTLLALSLHCIHVSTILNCSCHAVEGEALAIRKVGARACGPPGSYAAPHENSFVGDLVVGEIRGDEQFYTTTYEYENDSSWVVSLSLKLVINSGIINIVNAQNLEDSRSVVCATADTLGKSESILSIRIPALSRLKLYVLLGAH